MSRLGQTKLNLSPKEKYIVGDYIIKHCVMLNGQQYAHWDDESGGTDVSAAERLRPTIPKITVFHIRYLRQSFDLPLESAKVFYEAKKRQDEKLSEMAQLRDKVEALMAHVRECDVRLRDYGGRISALEEKYTAPKR